MKSTILIKPDEHYSEKIEDMKYIVLFLVKIDLFEQIPEHETTELPWWQRFHW